MYLRADVSSIEPVCKYLGKPKTSYFLFAILSHLFFLSYSLWLRHFRSENINVTVANILFVQSLPCPVSLFIFMQEYKSVTSGLAMRFVKNNITLSNSEVCKEVSDLTNTSVERQATNLDAAEPILFSNVIRKTDKAGAFLRELLVGIVIIRRLGSL